MGDDWSNMANTGRGETPVPPASTTVVPVAPNITDVTYHYGPDKNSTLRITAHPHHLEFNLVSVRGDCGKIRLFSPIFMGLRDFNQSPTYFRAQLMEIGNDFFAGIIASNEHTELRQHQHQRQKASAFVTFSPAFVPSNPSYTRNQRFAFFICHKAQLRRRIGDLETCYVSPFGLKIKRRRQNNIDYLFLLDTNGASAQDIIELCHQTGLGSVLLLTDLWCDWCSPEAPFHLRPEAVTLVKALKKAGLIVGLHSYVHKVPANGYYATYYPHQVSATAAGRFRCFTFDNDLPEMMSRQYAAKFKLLKADWTYFDEAEVLYESDGKHTGEYDHFLVTRVTRAMMQALADEGVMPVIHQQSSQGSNCYHYVSRTGQIDYWDGRWQGQPNPSTTPITSIEWAVSQAPHRRTAFLTPDLGWFGRRIHVYVKDKPPREREATWQEWQSLCRASIQANIPLGIRTSYQDFMTDPLKDKIVPLLRETIRQRQRGSVYK
jgi:hypothetical protein